MGAIDRLNAQLILAKRAPIISRKKPWELFGRIIEPGQLGLYSRGGCTSV